MKEQSFNEIELEGTAATPPVISHANHDITFYRFYLDVPRLSGQTDRLPVLLPSAMTAAVIPGSPLRLKGQLRSFNNNSGQGNRLILSVHAQAFLPVQGEGCNCVSLSGTLCKPPVFRRTPLGRSICDLMLAVPRRYGRSDYLPAIAWGQLAVAASQLRVGASLSLEGRMQSRIYTKQTPQGAEERTAYEVSIMHIPTPESTEASF